MEPVWSKWEHHRDGRKYPNSRVNVVEKVTSSTHVVSEETLEMALEEAAGRDPTVPVANAHQHFLG